MSKSRNRKSPFTHSLNPFLVDDTAERYLTALEHAEVLKKALLEMCRRAGFTPKDAPKTKMLAGELYEVLASRATRTDVDQKKAVALNARLTGWRKVRFLDLFETRVIFDLRDDWGRALAKPGPGISSSRLRDLVTSCLLHRSSRRLTVRKKKSQPARAARKAA